MAGMLNNMANLANAKLTADLTSSATIVTLDDASPFANLGTFYATIMPAGEMSRLSNSEIVKCDYASSTKLAITRAQRGTSARAFTSGAILTNGIYVEDLEQAQYVGDGVFDTSYSAGVYTITTNKNMLPAIPSDGMKINVRINTDSSGTPGLDLQGTGAIYSIYSGTLVNNELAAHAVSEGAALLAGETYELVFDDEVGGGCWKATGLVQLADVPFYEQVGSGSSHPIGTDDIEDGAVTPAKLSVDFGKYSGTETIIGTWIDGRPVYRKVLTGNTPNGNVSVNHGITNFSRILNVYGWVQSGSNGSQPVQRVLPDALTQYGIGVGDFKSTTFLLQVGTNGDIRGKPYTIILEYIKTV